MCLRPNAKYTLKVALAKLTDSYIVILSRRAPNYDSSFACLSLSVMWMYALFVFLWCCNACWSPGIVCSLFNVHCSVGFFRRLLSRSTIFCSHLSSIALITWYSVRTHAILVWAVSPLAYWSFAWQPADAPLCKNSCEIWYVGNASERKHCYRSAIDTLNFLIRMSRIFCFKYASSVYEHNPAFLNIIFIFSPLRAYMFYKFKMTPSFIIIIIHGNDEHNVNDIPGYIDLHHWQYMGAKANQLPVTHRL